MQAWIPQGAPAAACPLLLALLCSPAARWLQESEPQEPEGSGPQEVGAAPVESAPQEGPVDRSGEHFRMCDLDGSGWISLSEAEAALDVDRAEYRVFDADGDGRLTAPEFADRLPYMLALLGAGDAPPPRTDDVLRRDEPPVDESPQPIGTAPVPAPAPARRSAAPRAPFPAPEDLLSVYDRDGSGALDLLEVAESLRRAQALLSAEVILEQTDSDQSDALEVDELGLLASMLANREPWATRPEERAPATPAATGPEPRERGPVPTPDGNSGADPLAPLDPLPELTRLLFPESAPPVTPAAGGGHFARLDANGDGRIRTDDLEILLRPASTSVRGGTILSALDLDGDGSLNQAEFRAALER